MAHGTHDYADDPRNDDILVWVNGELLPRERAVVSVFDSGFVLGDGVWEGLRVRGGHPAFLEAHLDRLYEGAQAIMMDVGLTREQLTAAIYETLRGQRDGRRRARPADGDPRREVDAVPGPAGDRRTRDGRGHRRAQGADAGDRRRRHHAVHHPRAPGLPRHPRPEAQRAQQAQRHHRLHPGLHRGRRRGADARPARVRRDLQQHALLRRGRRRRAGSPRCGPPTAASAWPGSPAATCCGCAATAASRPGRRRSASPTSTAPGRRS